MVGLYRPLEEGEIRLLTIISHNEFTAVLQLETHPRDRAPDYDAVSYAWGEDLSTKSVSCNGICLRIRTNLFKALPYLDRCRPEPRRPLWIDAICLDQENKAEKAKEVPRMGKLFENAARTLVWLGESADDSELAINSMHDLTQSMLATEDTQFLTLRQRIARHKIPAADVPKWKAIKNLQLRPWFFRLWTLQEIVLSKAPLIICGNTFISWESFSALNQNRFLAQQNTTDKAVTDPETPYKDSQIAIQTIEVLRTLKREGTFLGLSSLLVLSVDRGYTEPVDRVWAVLGLLYEPHRQDLQDANVIDYSPAAKLDYCKTYVSIMKVQIRHDTVRAMNLIESNLQTLRNPSLPSWCPDWHTMKGGLYLQYMTKGASAGIPGGHYAHLRPVMTVNEDSSLDILGLSVDSIEEVTVTSGKDSMALKSYAWVKECLEMVKSIRQNADDIDHSTGTVSTASTDVSTIDEPQQRYDRAEEALIAVLYPPGVIPNVPEPNVPEGKLLWCNDRKFFRTKAGRFGLGPSDLKPDDLLCAMYGGRALFALRPYTQANAVPIGPRSRSSQRNVEVKEFKLLGSAYTPYLSNGEAFTGTDCDSMKFFRLV
jgi:hypothetical protein